MKKIVQSLWHLPICALIIISSVLAVFYNLILKFSLWCKRCFWFWRWYCRWYCRRYWRWYCRWFWRWCCRWCCRWLTIAEASCTKTSGCTNFCVFGLPTTKVGIEWCCFKEHPTLQQPRIKSATTSKHTTNSKSRLWETQLHFITCIIMQQK